MHDYILSCCSPVDLTQEKLDSLDVKMICSDYTMDGVPYKDDLGKTMPYREFYDRIRAGEVVYDGPTDQVTDAVLNDIYQGQAVPTADK